ncbi:tyrosine-type recombinase/integrase, partial [Chloroflexota bacterium]
LASVPTDKMDWSKVEYKHAQAVRAYFEKEYRFTTANRKLSALRGVLKNAWLLGQMPEAQYRKASQVKTLRGEAKPAGREISMGEISAIIEACLDGTPAGVRDVAIITLLYSTGIRRAELVGLDVENYNSETGKIWVISGKGRKDRPVWVANGAKYAMDDWLAIRGDDPGALFWPVNKSGVMTNKRLSTQAVWRIVEKRAKIAKVEDISPHDFRRTFITGMIRDHDLSLAADLAGHADVNTTRRYDMRRDEEKREAVKGLHVPYNGM